jgi:uncharacterized protein (DUF433 family)
MFRRVGRGAYSIADAHRFTGVPTATIRRWTRGYTYRYRREEHYTPPLIDAANVDVDGAPLLDFSDLIEIRFIDAFKRYGVSHRTLRISYESARELTGRTHPFSSQLFRTEGTTVIGEILRESGDKMLFNLSNQNFLFETVITPFLYETLEFEEGAPHRWWPLGKHRHVVLDPSRNLGAPIVSESSVPTRLLRQAFQAEGSVELVADWYQAKPDEVRDALAYEQSLAA